MEIVKRDMYSSEETMTGKIFDGRPVYRKVVMNLAPKAGYNKFKHGIASFDFIVSASGFVALKNGNCIPIPESCCDNLAKYGISLRDISKTDFSMLFGTGYIDSFLPIGAHVIFEYVKKV